MAEQALGDHRKLGEILVEHGSVSPDKVDEVVKRQSGEHRTSLAESTIESTSTSSIG
ncbi:MAG: hypothetical protein R2705_11130 [Ilumatobacteraceae bacterium]